MMTNLYIDTNFFIYLATPSSSFHKDCSKLVFFAKEKKINLVTSAETIQEIIYFTKNIKQLDKGLEIANEIMTSPTEILPVTQSIIKRYLEFVHIYKSATSSDLIHLASCIENSLNIIVTFDKDFQKFKEIKAVEPKELLKDH
jgi:predicted nucleic acid-binding protein